MLHVKSIVAVYECSIYNCKHECVMTFCIVVCILAGLLFMPVCVSVVVVVCVHACVARPSAALDGPGSAQQGARSLGLQGGDEHVHTDTDGETDEEKTGRRV